MKLVFKLTILALLGLCISGCMAKSAYYSDNKDEIEIIIDGIDAHDIVGINPYSITKNDKTVCILEFIDSNTYNECRHKAINSKSSIIMEMEKDDDKGLSYMMYKDENHDYNYLMKLNDTNHTLLLTSKYGRDKARDCYDKLNYVVKE